MKILQVSPLYYPFYGGVEERVKNLSENLARNHEVTVFSCDPSGKLPGEEIINSVTIRRFHCLAPGNAYYYSRDMLRELKRSYFDIVHAHNYHAFPLYLSRYTKRKRLIITPDYLGHGHTFFHNFLLHIYRPFGKRVLNEADGIIAVSNYEKELLLRGFTLDETKIRVIPNGINPAELSVSSKVNREPKTILSVCRLEKYKGVQDIIRVLPLLPDDYRLEIVGTGPYHKKLANLVKKLGINDRVSFHHNLPRDVLMEMYARAGIFILLSRYESFAIVIAEALASKTPCIVTNTSALVEWVDNKNCYGIDYPVDVGQLAELIKNVTGRTVRNPQLWDWEKVSREIEDFYSSLT